jgi:hypothetical protein
MGRNQDLRRKIVGREKVVKEHEAKIRRERMSRLSIGGARSMRERATLRG